MPSPSMKFQGKDFTSIHVWGVSPHPHPISQIKQTQTCLWRAQRWWVWHMSDGACVVTWLAPQPPARAVTPVAENPALKIEVD